MSLAVLTSSASSLQSTFVSPARTLLAMGHYGALPEKFAKEPPVMRTVSPFSNVNLGFGSSFDSSTREWSARAWLYIFAPESDVLSSLLVSIGIALAVTALSIVIALPAARAGASLMSRL